MIIAVFFIIYYPTNILYNPVLDASYLFFILIKSSFILVVDISEFLVNKQPHNIVLKSNLPSQSSPITKISTLKFLISLTFVPTLFGYY